MKNLMRARSSHRQLYALVFVGMIGIVPPSSADEGGTGFWLPGQYGSFAAIAPEPGFGLALVSYWYSANASGEQALGFGNNLKLDVDARYFGQFIVPSYTPETTLWGGRPSFFIAFIPAQNRVAANVSVGGIVTAASDRGTGISDL